MSFPAATVWNRHSYFNEKMSQRTFIAAFSLWTAAGIALSALGAAASYDWQPSWSLLLGLFAMTLGGVFVAIRGEHIIMSIIGYMMIALPFGLMTGPIVAMYTPASVFKVLTVTCGMVVGLGVVGAIYPRSLEHWSVWLLGALFVLILGSLMTIFAGAVGMQTHGAMRIWDWIAVVLFSGFVVYDMNRAVRIERTHKNAVDIAIAIYLDFANLFLHLLSIMGTPVKRD